MAEERSREPQERLRALLLDELRRAWIAARAAGADPAALRRIVAERRLRLLGVEDNGEYGVDDPPEVGWTGK